MLVFIGPCIAKKDESDEVDAVITFAELRQMLTARRIRPSNVERASFTPPLARKGAGFPVSRGLLQSMCLEGNHVDQRVIVAEGRVHFQEAIREYADGHLGSMQLELLCCEGCIIGAGNLCRGKEICSPSKCSQLPSRSFGEYAGGATAVGISKIEFEPQLPAGRSANRQSFR